MNDAEHFGRSLPYRFRRLRVDLGGAVSWSALRPSHLPRLPSSVLTLPHALPSSAQLGSHHGLVEFGDGAQDLAHEASGGPFSAAMSAALSRRDCWAGVDFCSLFPKFAPR